MLDTNTIIIFRSVQKGIGCRNALVVRSESIRFNDIHTQCQRKGMDGPFYLSASTGKIAALKKGPSHSH